MGVVTCRNPVAAFFAAMVAVTLASCGSVRDEATFTEEVAEELRQEMRQGAVRVKAPRTLEVTYPDGTSSTPSLDNLWRDCSLRPEECDASIERFVRAIGEQQGAHLKLSRESIRVTVRGRAWVDELTKLGEPPVARAFVGDLWKVYVFDLPDSMAAVRAKDLKTLVMSEEELDAVALSNLTNALVEFPHEPVQEGSPIRVLHAGDSYEASRILLHASWVEISQKVKGELLVSVPSRDYVFFVGSGESPQVLKKFRQLVEERARVESHPIS